MKHMGTLVTSISAFLKILSSLQKHMLLSNIHTKERHLNNHLFTKEKNNNKKTRKTFLPQALQKFDLPFVQLTDSIQLWVVQQRFDFSTANLLFSPVVWNSFWNMHNYYTHLENTCRIKYNKYNKEKWYILYCYTKGGLCQAILCVQYCFFSKVQNHTKLKTTLELAGDIQL